MKKFLMTCSFVIFSAFSICATTANAQSQYQDEEEGMDYDTLLQKLSRREIADTTPQTDPFENIKIHTGVGLTNSTFSLHHPNGDSTFASQRGIQVSLGIDLFSKNWLAEGTFRNFGDSRYENANIGMKEFDLKLLYQSRLASAWAYRIGGGIAARYMNINYSGKNGEVSREIDIPDPDHPGQTIKKTIKEYAKQDAYNQQAQTPASVVQAGVLTYVTTGFSVGADASLRNAVIEETPDRMAFDITLRLDGHF